MHLYNNPLLCLRPGILGDIAGVKVRIGKGLYQGGKPASILMFVYVAPPIIVGVWSMALVLRQRIEYYFYSPLTRSPIILFHVACRKGLEEQIEKLKEEKKTVKAELELIEEKYGGLDNELQEMKHNNKALTEATVDMEVRELVTQSECFHQYVHLACIYTYK